MSSIFRNTGNERKIRNAYKESLWLPFILAADDVNLFEILKERMAVTKCSVLFCGSEP
jgi:hypothetical protein